jgi:hypothetical protein
MCSVCGLNSLSSSKDLLWCLPSNEILKLNVDVAMSQSAVTIFVIARNEAGIIMKVWAKPSNSIDPLVAEATAILWAIQVAKIENWSNICFENDSKMRVDFLLEANFVSSWNIELLYGDVKSLAVEFIFVVFVGLNVRSTWLHIHLPKWYLRLNSPPFFSLTISQPT